MPLYDIEHIIPLTDEQQLALANALAKAHTARFHTPSYFVNVRFTDVSNMKVYRSGRLVNTIVLFYAYANLKIARPIFSTNTVKRSLSAGRRL